MNTRTLLSIGAAAAMTAGAANAQLVVGNDDTLVGGTNAWYVDLTTGASRQLWQNSEAWGLACDDANRAIYATDGTPMTRWDYYSGGTVTPLGSPVSSVDGVTMLFVGLAFNPANGTLYGGRNTNTTNNPEGIYSIDTTVSPPVCTLFWAPGVTSYDWGGLGCDPTTGLFYMTSDTAPTGVGSGLFVIDTVASTVTKLAAYPGGETDVDGCEVVGGKVWLVTDDALDPLYSWDIALGAYDVPTLTSPMPTTEIFSSAGHSPTLAAFPTVSCTPLGPNADACSTAISASAQPNTTHTSGCTITVSDLPPMRSGTIFYSTAGAQNLSWCAGGVGNARLCLVSPTSRTGIQDSGGGAAACDGTMALDWDAYQIAVGGVFAAGDKAWVQCWFRSTSDCRTTFLSEALELTYWQ
jgi:hypothetical protein